MNLQNKLKYVSFRGISNTHRTENIQNTILNNINSIFGLIRINNYIICHGGINPNFVKKYNNQHNQHNNDEFVISYNKMLRETLTNIEPDYSLLNDKYGPFWDRSNGLDSKQLSNDECELLFFNNILNISDKKYISDLKFIVAHCPQTVNSNKKGINLTNCGKYPNKIWRIDVAMSRAFDMYISDPNVINILLDKIQTRSLNLSANNINILDFYVNRDKELNKVQILKINKDKTEEIITGVISLEYFYNTVFSEQDVKYKFLYLLLDMYKTFSRKLNSSYGLEISILNKIKKIKTKLFHELYPRDDNDTMIIQIR